VVRRERKKQHLEHEAIDVVTDILGEKHFDGEVSMNRCIPGTGPQELFAFVDAVRNQSFSETDQL
jgi:hypothetical protein